MVRVLCTMARAAHCKQCKQKKRREEEEGTQGKITFTCGPRVHTVTKNQSIKWQDPGGWVWAGARGMSMLFRMPEAAAALESNIHTTEGRLLRHH